ncbi:MAG: hemolysin family protein [Halobacteria archaeon]
MNEWTAIYWILLIALLILSAFFSASEMAIFSSNKIRMKKYAENGNKNAILIEQMFKNPERVLNTILVGNNIVNLGAAAVATAIAIDYFGDIGIGIATGMMALLILTFGEIVPKSYAAKNANQVALAVAKPMNFLIRLFSPVVLIFNGLANSLIKALGGETIKPTPRITQDELKMLLKLGEQEGVVEKGERKMINGIFEFGEKTAKEVMLPRIDMDCIEVKSTLEEALKVLLKKWRSRLPVYDGTIDNIVGILNLKDLLHLIKEKKYSTPIKEIIRPPYFIPDSKKLRDLLKEFQQNRIQMAIVIDEYGGTAGLITLEDLLEEIVGEILDEYDAIETQIQMVNDKIAIVDAKTNIDEVNEALGVDLPSGEYETIGGLIFDRLGKIPSPGEKIEVDGKILIVESMRGRRISKVKIILPKSIRTSLPSA